MKDLIMGTTKFALHLKRAKQIRKNELYCYTYKYFDNMGTFFELDEYSTKKFGSSQKAFQRWLHENEDIISINKNNDVIVKFCSSTKETGEIKKLVFISRITNECMIDELRDLFEKIFTKVVKILHVKDIDSFRYYIIGGEEYLFLTAEDVINRINKLEKVLKLYFIDEKMKILINKIIR